MTLQPRTHSLKPAILLPPALDVLFLTVFFLLLGGNWLISPGLVVKAGGAIFMPGGFSDPVVIAVRSDNRILLQGRLLDAADWPGEIRAFFEGEKKAVLVVAAPEAGTKIIYALLSLLSELGQEVVLSTPQSAQTEPPLPEPTR